MYKDDNIQNYLVEKLEEHFETSEYKYMKNRQSEECKRLLNITYECENIERTQYGQEMHAPVINHGR